MVSSSIAHPARPGSFAMHKFAAMATMGLRVGDAVVLVAAACLAYWLRFDTFWPPIEYQRTVARAVILMLLVFGKDGEKQIPVRLRIDTPIEVAGSRPS